MDGIGRHGYAIDPLFTTADEVRTLVREARQSWKRGELRRAAVGQRAAARVDAEIRGDQILWLDPEDPRPGLRDYFRRLEELRFALNRKLFLGLFDLEAHFAVYPPGSYYRRHLDRFRTDQLRTVSVILYLNPRWGASDGGELRLYLESLESPQGVLDVHPVGGTLVAFLSGEIEHEVLPTRRPRWSLTAWLRRRP